MGAGHHSAAVHEEKKRMHEASREMSVTTKAVRQAQSGGGINRLVDPRTHNVSRQAHTVWEQLPSGLWTIPYGVVLPYKMGLDTTGSMGDNVDVAFKALPQVYRLIGSMLSRYHLQIATALIQDVCDGNEYVHMHSEFEGDNRVEDQMAMMVPIRGGGDSIEDYQLDLWYTGYRVDSGLWAYGLKGYYFIIGDEMGRSSLDKYTVDAVYNQPGLVQSSLSLQDLGRELSQHWHVFYLQLGDSRSVSDWWEKVLGTSNRIIHLPTDHAEDMAIIQAAVVGLTEGILDPQEIQKFLIDETGVSRSRAGSYANSLVGIPLGAQAQLPNFNRLPKVGDVFQNKGDLWPIENTGSANPAPPSPTWQL